MKDYNYKYIVTPNKVIAISTYAGRPVRGIAKCHPNDIFDEAFGKQLAAARCNAKIAKKRYLNAEKKWHDALVDLRDANVYYERMRTYRDDAFYAYREAQDDLNDL